MLDDFIAVIEILQKRIEDHRSSLQGSETRTRVALIDPLLQALEWDVSDPALVTPEYHQYSSGRADYALQGPGRPAAVIEAKHLGIDIENKSQLEKALGQAVNYCLTKGIAYAGVTNGDRWKLYRTFEEKPLWDKIVLDVRISNTPAYNCALQLLLLWRPNLASGQPEAAREPIFGHGQVPDLANGPVGSSPAKIENPQPAPPLPAAPQAGWIPLSDQLAAMPTPPTAIRFSDGHEDQELIYWRHLVEYIAAWLWSTKKLHQNNVPVGTGGKKRYIINTEPFHANGNRFTSERKVPNSSLYYDGAYDSKILVNHSRKLLKHCRVDPATVLLQPGE